ncbi:MAG TPA: TIGR02452 family protein [Pyrinomonadaceae bacterium]|jgi:uncharacterized protein (TIGR02452 family)
MNNLNRIELAQNTLRIIEQGSYRNDSGETVSIKDETVSAVENSKLFRTEDFPENFELEKNPGETSFEITDETTLEAAKRICRENANENPFVLNFASGKNPGGGFLRGTIAQEESLAYASALYAVLTPHSAMYEHNRRNGSALYSDWMIYSPRVPVFRNDDGSLLQNPYSVTFLTSPAVNAGALRQNQPDKVHLIEPTNRERARKFLWLANRENHRTLILGAWGCGVFHNDPREIAAMFRDLLTGEFENSFARVIMAIYDKTPARNVYNAFAKAFG